MQTDSSQVAPQHACNNVRLSCVHAKNAHCDRWERMTRTSHERPSKKCQFKRCGCSSVDRVLASEAKGRGFDPRQPHHIFRFFYKRRKKAVLEFEILRKSVRVAKGGRL